jgi:molybdopterin converting factor small subunit
MGELRVLFFASARQAAGCAEATIACEPSGIGTIRLARNCEYLGVGEHFFPRDEAALIPPVSGG